MKFEHTQTRDDGGGYVTVTAESAAEVSDLAGHFRMFDKENPEELVQLADAIKAGTLVHSTSDKRPWYVVESALDVEFTEPFRQRLERITGYDGQIPNLDLTPDHPRRLCHTHITDRAWIEHGHICFVAMDAAEEWNGRTAADNAWNNCVDYVSEDFGTRKHEPEYVPIRGGGLMKHNPNYLKRHKAEPGHGNGWLLEVLLNWWEDEHATGPQRDILYGARQLSNSFNLAKEYGIYYPDEAGTVNWDSKGTKVGHMSIDDFRNLGKAVQA